MRERAEIVGGRLEVWSKLDIGTEMELSIPGDRLRRVRPAVVAVESTPGDGRGNGRGTPE